MTALDFGDLVKRAQGRDVGAFATLVRHFQNRVWSYAFALCRDPEDAADIAQDTFFEAFRRLNELREPRALGAWLRKIAFKQFDRRARLRAPRVVALEEAPEIPAREADPYESLAADELARRMFGAWSGLPPNQREAIALIYGGDFSQAEMASFLGIQLSAVKKRLLLGKENLKRRIATMEEDRDPKWNEAWKALAPSRNDDFSARLEALLRAAADGQVDEVRRLLAGDKRLAQGADSSGKTPLHLAAEHGHGPIVELLVALGAERAARDSGDNATPLHWAAAGGHLDIVRFLVEQGDVDLDERSDEHGLGVVGWALFSGHSRQTAEYLLSKGASIDVFSAVALSDVEALEKIVASDPSALTRRLTRHDDARTPLHVAALMGLLEMVRTLIEAGADPHARTYSGKTPLSCALGPNPDNLEGRSAVQRYLLALPVDVDLCSAIELGRYDEAKLKVAADPSLIAPGGPWSCVILTAAACAPPDLVEWLISQGADVKCRDPFEHDMTPLHAAAIRGNAGAVPVLLKHGADPEAKDRSFGSTPLGWARHAGQHDVVALLEA